MKYYLPKTRGDLIFNASLAKYSWFQIGGSADILFKPEDLDDLQNFLTNLDKNILITIIGCGSNLIIRDGGIRGVTIIIKDNLKNIQLNGENNIEVECGIDNLKLYNFAKKNQIGGFEFLGTIPGTLGGAIRGNAGCHGSEIKDILLDFKAIDFSGSFKIFNKNDFCFEYRKNNLSGDLIFVSATLDGSKKNDVKNIENIFNEMIEKRNNNQPIGVKTCGSTFKNPVEKPAWKIVQELGYQGKNINGIKMSEKHANFMININCEKANHLEDLGNEIIEKAKLQQGLNLEWEIKIVGER